MTRPDPDILPRVRARIEAAEAEIAAACDLLRGAGWPETAGDLGRSLTHVGVWTQPGGWLEHLEDAPR